MLLNSVRQAVLQDVLIAAGAPFPMVTDLPYVEPYCFCDADTMYIYLVNGSSDEADGLPLRLPIDFAPNEVSVWSSEAADTDLKRIPVKFVDGSTVLPLRLASMESLLLRISATSGNA